MIASDFRARLTSAVHDHPIVRHNPYTSWLARGEADAGEVARFTREFSVFSHQFILAQTRKVINSADVEQYHAGKEILLNELGVAFRSSKSATTQNTTPKPSTLSVNGDSDLSPNLAPSTGSVEGGTYRHASAHFEWLVAFAKPLGLGFADLGKRRHGSPSTLAFCDALLELYGSEDPDIAEGASFAIEHWAAAGFWGEIIQGLTQFRERSELPLNLGFWTFHDRLEQQHADHVSDELEEAMARPGFDEEPFLFGAKALLDAVQGFWQGLADDRTQSSTVSKGPARRTSERRVAA